MCRQGDTTEVSVNGQGTATAQLEQISTIKLQAATNQNVTLVDSTLGDTLTVTGGAGVGNILITSSLGGSVAFAAPRGLTIQAGAGSTVDISGVTNLEGGNLTVSAGSIQVDGSLISHGGSIDLDAGAQGSLLVSGNIDVSNRASGQLGGSVELLGNHVGLVDQAAVDASGDAGGGSVIIGGGAHGANAEILNASSVFVSSDSVMNASAATSGNGGNIVVWSDSLTQFYGSIDARGGALGGNGGFVEVSSGQNLTFDGRVDVAAPDGRLGTLLLDPRNITVQSGGTATYSQVNAFSVSPASNFTVDPATLAAVTGNVVLEANNDIRVNDPITLTTPGQSLTLEAGGSILINANITTNGGGQTYENAVVVTANAVLTDTSGGTIRFQSSVEGDGTLLVRTDGTTEFDGPVAGTTDLSGLQVQGFSASGNGTTDINGGLVITAGGGQAYENAVVLTANTTLIDSASGTIRFASSVDGDQTLLAETDGTTAFDGPVGGATPLAVLQVQGLGVGILGITDINGGSVTTAGGQTYGNDVFLTADTVLTDNAGGTIHFYGSLSGNQTLLVRTDGTTEFDGPVAGTTDLAGLHVQGLSASSNGITDINGKTVITAGGGQTYDNAVVLTADTTLIDSAGGTIRFSSSVDGDQTLLAETDGTTAFDGPVGGATPLAVLQVQGLGVGIHGITDINGGSVTTAGGQTYGNVVFLTADTVLTDNAGGTIHFYSSVNGNQTLVVRTDGTTEFDGPVGGSTPLAALQVQGLSARRNGTTDINGGSVTTAAGGQTYENAVVLTADTLLTDNSSGTIRFANSVDGDQTLVVQTDGIAEFDGPVGGTTPLAGLQVQGYTAGDSGITEIIAANVTTAGGGQTYGNEVVIIPGAVLTDNSSGTIRFASSVGVSEMLLVQTDGTTVFDGPVAGTSPSAGLQVQGFSTTNLGTTDINGGSVTMSAGGQTYDNAVVLTANTTLRTITAQSGPAITFNSTVDSQSGENFSLTLNAASGSVTFEGDLGASQPLGAAPSRGPTGEFSLAGVFQIKP